MKIVNLARRPFVNVRPVVRLTVVLWLLGVLLLAANFLFYARYWRDSAEIRGQLAAVERERNHEEESLDELNQQAAGLDLEAQIDQVIYLNRLIRNRTFPWSDLFEDLEEILPPDVRLSSVQPSVRFEDNMPKRRRPVTRSRPSRTSRRSSTRRSATPEQAQPRRPLPAAAGPEEVRLQLPGFAKSDEALMEFVDALYANPSFQRPVLRNETRDSNRGGVVFSIEVVYLTQWPGDPAAAAAADSPAIAQESAPPPDASAAPPGEPDAPETVVADDGTGAPAPPPATAIETAAGPSPEDEDEERPEVLAAAGVKREDLPSHDARSDDSKPEDRGAATQSSRARARLDAVDDAATGPDEVGAGHRPPVRTGSGYRPPAQTGSGYRPPARTGSGYRPPARTGPDRPPARTQPQDRSQDETRPDAASTRRDTGGRAPIQPVKPSFVKPSATGTPRLQGALPRSRLVEEART